jgi:CBS domain-containing protein
VETISENALLHEALLLLQKNNVSHLATVDSSQQINGLIGYKEIMELQQNSIGFLIREIEVAEDVSELVRIYRKLPTLIRALIECGDKTDSIARIISSVADAMLNRVIQFGVKDLGQAPCEFAFMVMGSEGRKEQTLATDQDNAIIIEDSNKEGAQGYFLELGAKVNKDLDTIGYRLCKGEIMAKNPKWTQPLETWKSYFSKWINNSTPQDILDAAIFFDFRFVYGNESLVSELRRHVNEVSDSKSVFFFHMAQSILTFKPPLNIFGNIVGKETSGEETRIDIKMVLLPVITFIRLYSIQEGLIHTKSLERISELFRIKKIDTSSYEEIVLAIDLLTRMRIKAQVETISDNGEPGNMIHPGKLSRSELASLKAILSQISDLQTKVNFDFKAS